jgi:hypothetical protein
VITTQELKAFVAETMSNRQSPHKRVKTGDISAGTRAYIEKEFGVKLKDIDTDRHGIIHALKKAAHNLEPDDLLYAVEVINLSKDVTLSDEQHNRCPVLIFKHDIGGGELTILTEIHAKDGYLLVWDAWRQKKARRGATANKPSANVQDAAPRA